MNISEEELEKFYNTMGTRGVLKYPVILDNQLDIVPDNLVLQIGKPKEKHNIHKNIEVIISTKKPKDNDGDGGFF